MVINIDQGDDLHSTVSSDKTVPTAQNPVNESEIKTESFLNLLFLKLGIANSTNPLICIFHLLFKGLAIFTYIFAGFTFNSVTIFLFVSIFAVLDFWFVKNISGRFLAHLRWWSIVDEKGNEKWMFESFDQEVNGNPIDSFVFWYGQIFACLFWTLTLGIKILTFGLFWV